MPCDGFDRQIFGLINAQKHDHEQKQHHNGAGIHDHLDRSQKLRVLVQEKDRNREQRQHQRKRRVHRVAEPDEPQRSDDRQRASDEEDNKLH